MVGVDLPTSEIGCLLGVWGGSGKLGIDIAIDSLFDSMGRFSGSIYPVKT